MTAADFDAAPFVAPRRVAFGDNQFGQPLDDDDRDQ